MPAVLHSVVSLTTGGENPSGYVQLPS